MSPCAFSMRKIRGELPVNRGCLFKARGLLLSPRAIRRCNKTNGTENTSPAGANPATASYYRAFSGAFLFPVKIRPRVSICQFLILELKAALGI